MSAPGGSPAPPDSGAVDGTTSDGTTSDGTAADGTAADDSARPRAGAASSEQALARHARAMRRSRTIYFAVVAVVLIALGAFAAVVWSRGEAAHVTLRTASQAPPSLGLSVPATDEALAWRTADRAALGSPQYGGTVVTWGEHAVRGRNARTGEVTWSYTRSDRTMCTSAQVDGTTMAVYAVNGNCDEVTALDSDTGERRWTRTLDKDGMPLNGTPSYAWTGFTFAVYSSSVIYAIDPASGLDRWTYTRFGCRIERMVLGSSGALISQDCVRPRCGNLAKCKAGPQLLLRDGSAPNGDDSKADRDQVTWNLIGNTGLAVSADAVIAAFDDSTGKLTQYRADDGSTITTVRLSNTPTSAQNSVAADTSDAQILWLGGVTYALTAGRSRPIWATTTLSAPTVVSTSGTAADLPTARFTVATATGAALLDGNSGRVSLSARLPAPGRNSLVFPLGNGFLVTGSAGVRAYR